MPEVIQIPISKIEVNESALRGPQLGNEKFAQLCASIKRYGIKQNLTVYPSKTADGMYVLIDGLQRFTAAQQVGLTTVPAAVEDVDESQALVLQMQTNIQSIETKPAEYAKQLDRILRHNPRMTLTELGAMVCQRADWVSARLGLLRLLEPIQKMVDDGSINLTNARTLSEMDEDSQKEWVERAMKMTSDQFVPAARKHILEAKKAKKELRSQVVETFTPIARRRSESELNAEIEKCAAAATVIKSDMKPLDVWRVALQWAMRMDPESLALAEQKWTEEKIARDKRREEAKAAREAAKEAKAAELAASVL